MRYDKTTKILDVRGGAIIDRNPDGTVADPADPIITFGKLAVLALLSQSPDPDTQQAFKPAVKVRHADLAEEIEAADRYIDLTIEQSATLKKLVGFFPPLWVKRCWEILDNPLPSKPPSERAKPSPRAKAPAQT